MQQPGHPDRGHRTRATTLGVAATLTAIVGDWAAWHGLLTQLHGLQRRGVPRTLDAVPVLVWAGLVLALLWAALLIALATASVLRTGRGGGEGASTPGRGPRRPTGVVDRLAVVLLAVTALSSFSAAAPACATTAAAAPVAAATTFTGDGLTAADDAKTAAASNDSCVDGVPAPGWVPDRPTRTDQVARACAPLITGKPVADDSGEVVVRRGDTLWSIAAAHLGPHADARAIAAEWPRWYDTNKEVIGDDPDLLMIGIRLQLPDHTLEGSAR